MDLERIRELLKLVADSGVAEVEIEDEEFRLLVRTSHPALPPAPQIAHAPMHAVAPVAAAPAAVNPQPEAPGAGPAPISIANANEVVVNAPIVGTFYASPSPDSDAFVSVGDTVQVGDVLCIIEAMKLMNEIEAEVSGTVRKILVDDAQPVQYDEPLFVIEP
ncbi:MAG: acetyl-CoA carboxylase biotin carboxyl carrier protein [Rhodothermales bacterium]|nr:acetyl-CoA carboxylase biotin carboxyl carrier protein [Rhodothermales bacterium]